MFIELASLIALALLCGTLVALWIYTVVITLDQSMQPTAYSGDMLFIRRAYRYAVGDIIVFFRPDNKQLTVKRIKVVQIHKRKMYYYIEGDNTNHSIDSRHFGLIPRSAVRGKVIAIVKTGIRDFKKLKVYNLRKKAIRPSECQVLIFVDDDIGTMSTIIDSVKSGINAHYLHKVIFIAKDRASFEYWQKHTELQVGYLRGFHRYAYHEQHLYGLPRFIFIGNQTYSTLHGIPYNEFSEWQECCSLTNSDKCREVS